MAGALSEQPEWSLAAGADAQATRTPRSQRNPVAGIEAGGGGVEEAVFGDVCCQCGELFGSAQAAGVGEEPDLPGGVVAAGDVEDGGVEAAGHDGVDADAATGDLARGR